MDLDRSSRGQKGGTASARGAPSANARSDYADENMKPQQSVAKTSSRQPDKKTTPDGKKSDSLSQKTPQATAEQLRMAQMFQNSPTTDQALQEKALQVLLSFTEWLPLLAPFFNHRNLGGLAEKYFIKSIIACRISAVRDGSLDRILASTTRLKDEAKR